MKQWSVIFFGGVVGITSRGHSQRCDIPIAETLAANLGVPESLTTRKPKLRWLQEKMTFNIILDTDLARRG